MIDDTGAPVAGVGLKLEIFGTPRMTNTDGRGEAKVEWVEAGTAKLMLMQVPSILKMLEPKWAKRPQAKGRGER